MFKYQRAKARLDEFAREREGFMGPKFRLAWKRFVHHVVALGAADYGWETPEKGLSRAWEEAQLAFTGQGDNVLSAAACELWDGLVAREHEEFRLAIMEAFQMAEEDTSPLYDRLYLPRTRLQPPVVSREGFSGTRVLPNAGPDLRVWATGEGLDTQDVEQQYRMLEIRDRGTTAELLAENKTRIEKARKELEVRIYKGGKAKPVKGSKK